MDRYCGLCITAPAHILYAKLIICLHSLTNNEYPSLLIVWPDDVSRIIRVTSHNKGAPLYLFIYFSRMPSWNYEQVRNMNIREKGQASLLASESSFLYCMNYFILFYFSLFLRLGRIHFVISGYCSWYIYKKMV